MPPALLFDISGIDLTQVLFDQEYVRTCNPQRGEMEQLNGIIWVDANGERIIGYKDVREDEFWIAGHIPGRPLLPGVLMIEAAAQLASFYTRKYVGWKGFIGFGGADRVRFRQTVAPGRRLYLIAEQQWHRHHRIECKVQGIIDGSIVFECSIVGTEM
jgi:3-hydroxyacyl-[acyl-carrier-protein] dehydratase